MKFTVPAGELAAAIHMIALPLGDKRIGNIEVLSTIRIVVDGEHVRLQSNVLDHAITTTVVAAVDDPGEAAVPGVRFAKLVAGFTDDMDVTVATKDTAVSVTCGRGRYRLPTLPIDQLPPMPELDHQELGAVELPRGVVSKLFTAPTFAASTETTRYYLNGICLHDTDDGFAAVATDGHRLARLLIPGAAKLSADRRLIVPLTGIKIIVKLLAADRAAETVTLRRSRTLFQVETNRFNFVSKIIDADYPSYERLIPEASSNNAECSRYELAQAIARVAAVVDPADKGGAIVLEWSAGDEELRLSLARQPGAGDDSITAVTSGAGMVAVQAPYIGELLYEIRGERVALNVGGPDAPVLVSDPASAELTILQMPVRLVAA